MTEHGEQLVKFSVTVEVAEQSTKSGKIEANANFVSVISGRAGVEGGKESNDRSAHVIEFSVPMNFGSVWRHEEGDE